MTKYVVDGFINEFVQQHISVDCFAIEDIDAGSIDLSMYDAMGIAYPVHSLNAPEIVIRFAKRLPQSNGTRVFIIHSAGEDNKYNYASSDLLIKILNKKGYRVYYNKLFEMPSNFAVKYDTTKVKRILNKVNKDIPHDAEDITRCVPHKMNMSFIAKVFAFIGRVEWPGTRMLGKLFYTKTGCNQCGTCVDNCPNNNIVMSKKSVTFKWRCGLCMRCVYQCSKNVISIRQPFRFICLYQWYDSKLFK